MANEVKVATMAVTRMRRTTLACCGQLQRRALACGMSHRETLNQVPALDSRGPSTSRQKNDSFAKEPVKHSSHTGGSISNHDDRHTSYFAHAVVGVGSLGEGVLLEGDSSVSSALPKCVDRD